MSFLRPLVSRPLRTILNQRVVLASHAHQHRRISFTPIRRQSNPSPEELMATLQHTSFFKEIQSNPELKDALMDAAKVLQEEGFDANKPSMMMFVTNKRLRESMSRVMAAFQAANVDLASAKEALELVRSKMNANTK